MSNGNEDLQYPSTGVLEALNLALTSDLIAPEIARLSATSNQMNPHNKQQTSEWRR